MAAGQIDVPAMDRPSVAFAWFLETMDVVEIHGEFGPGVLTLTCNLCSDEVCVIDNGDNLRVLLNTALAHDCPSGKKGGK